MLHRSDPVLCNSLVFPFFIKYVCGFGTFQSDPTFYISCADACLLGTGLRTYVIYCRLPHMHLTVCTTEIGIVHGSRSTLAWHSSRMLRIQLILSPLLMLSVLKTSLPSSFTQISRKLIFSALSLPLYLYPWEVRWTWGQHAGWIFPDSQSIWGAESRLESMFRRSSLLPTPSNVRCLPVSWLRTPELKYFQYLMIPRSS